LASDVASRVYRRTIYNLMDRGVLGWQTMAARARAISG
jgi:hypothetical protein